MVAPPESVGIGADTAQMLGGGVFSAAARQYLRPAGKWMRAMGASSLCIGGSYLFGPWVVELVHGVTGANLPRTVAGAVAGLACIGISEGILTAADRLDLTLWSPFTRHPAPAVVSPPITPTPVPPIVAPTVPTPPEHHP
ncbi:hypothetical protein J2792_002313 [Novosphingobium capsulatum]|uniref:Phage holin n=1 Tax=Novosphingobium capsulatum TaxID=13688 RepID=A0ABU1MM77_9SPHN|nr:hypothetical protein [Novosphingobium capsulatum]MDR6511441.1 hypothetical protein [Novosphingobium capsulatum]